MQIRRGARVRLVKGAFAAAHTVALARRADIKANSRRLIDLMFSREARDAGFYPIVATHDDRLQACAVERAAAGGWRQDDSEFEMLFGVRPDLPEIWRGRASGFAFTCRSAATGGHMRCGVLAKIRKTPGCCCVRCWRCRAGEPAATTLSARGGEEGANSSASTARAR